MGKQPEQNLAKNVINATGTKKQAKSYFNCSKLRTTDFG